MQILHVTPIARSMTTEVLTYFSAKPVMPGSFVTVPLRKKEIKALVLHAVPVTNIKIQLRGADYQIRNIVKIHQEQVFSFGYLKTCTLLKDFYATNTGKLINLISPSFILKNIENFHRPTTSNHQNNALTFLLQRDYADRISYYKTSFREKMVYKKSIHIICSTQQETIDVHGELFKNNEQNVFLLHSKVTKKKIEKIFLSLHTNDKPTCIISTPGFIDTYQYNKSTLIIENESSEHYRTVGKPHIDMRVFIHEYAKNSSLECIFSASILRPETWHLVETTQAHIIEPFNKKVFKNLEIEINNLHQRKPGKQDDRERFEELTETKGSSIFNKKSLDALREAVATNKKVFIFSLKKSLAPSIICRYCGNMARCPESGFPYSLYIKQNQQTKIKERIFICKNTGEKIPAFDVCQFCNGHHLVIFGIGTETIYEELSKRFPETAIHIIDGNNNTTAKKIDEVFQEHTTTTTSSIIIGTQKALPYIEKSDLSIISSLDSYFAKMSYSISPQAITLIKNISEKTTGKFIIQSRNIIESILPLLRHGIYSTYIQQELEERKEFMYPPFSTLIVLKQQIQKEQLKKHYLGLNRLLDSYQPQILIQPGVKKGSAELITLIQLEIKEWNYYYQNEKLLNILLSLERSTQIYINPKDLN
jgi:primosomal protein N'